MSESHSHPGYKFCVWSKTFHVLRLLYQVTRQSLDTLPIAQSIEILYPCGNAARSPVSQSHNDQPAENIS